MASIIQISGISAARYCRDPLIPPPFGGLTLVEETKTGRSPDAKRGQKKPFSRWKFRRNCSFSNQAWDFLSIFLRLAHSLLVSRDEQVHKNSFGISYSTFNFSTTKHQYQYHLLTVFPQNPPKKTTVELAENVQADRGFFWLFFYGIARRRIQSCISACRGGKIHGTHVTCGMSCR